MHTKKVVKKECCGPESVQCGSGSNFLGQNGSGSSSGLNSDDGTDTPVLYVQYTTIPLHSKLYVQMENLAITGENVSLSIFSMFRCKFVYKINLAFPRTLLAKGSSINLLCRKNFNINLKNVTSIL